MNILNNEIFENVTTSTANPPHNEFPIWAGYVSVIISVIFFGTNFVPAAKYKIGDGVSFQFFLCCGIWVTGVVVHIIVGNYYFYPLVIVGGVLWTTGNILSVFVIPINGLGVSMLLWCTSNLFIGWASGHFGWFGLKAEKVEKPILNYLGVAIAVISGLIFLAIRIGKKEDDIFSIDSSQSPILNSSVEDIDNSNNPSNTTFRMRIIGYILAILSGVLFGLVFTPSTYIQDHHDQYKNATKNGLDYIFSLYTGIFFSSFIYYAIYIIMKRNRPYICVESIFPAFLSGIMWAIAEAGFIVANSVLSQAISFPLISIGPGTIAALWSILYIKDIRGSRNYIIFSIGTFIRIIAAVFIILSKPIPN
ncbi:unnamed protein product [Adineta steineri]|uniref:Transmembrane protein 144 n=1 Tax=Adineta steineri TaxID=433720 RepID=A0A814TJD0_9BILA|nr:unnamed protein product [Adineta steineri]CAF1163058.1 unnamed protein product [Adineta steineri]CAF1245760.1 unnamed protein product [Adineta steineri]CAF3654451.1 unnamed protein product [Adineta steineri]CAF3848917.1 unnamed protein product [Adineta steineri]